MAIISVFFNCTSLYLLHLSYLWILIDKLYFQSKMVNLNPYHDGQILPILRSVPRVTKVTLLHFIHALPSVTKVSATIVLQKF